MPRMGYILAILILQGGDFYESQKHLSTLDECYAEAAQMRIKDHRIVQATCSEVVSGKELAAVQKD